MQKTVFDIIKKLELTIPITQYNTTILQKLQCIEISTFFVYDKKAPIVLEWWWNTQSIRKDGRQP